MNAMTFRHPAQSGSYRSFRDEAVSRQARRLRRKDLSRRKRNAFVAALALAAAVLSATAAASLFTSDVNKVVSRNPPVSKLARG